MGNVSDGMRRNYLLAAAIFVISCLSLTLLASCSQTTEGVAAQSGDVVIMEDDVTAYTATYRKNVDAEDDGAWALYMRGNGYDTKTWREHVIRELAARQLIEKKAAEKGIEPDEEQVAESIAKLKESRDVASDDDEAWRTSLEQDDMTPEQVEADYRYASILEQVLLDEGQSEFSTDEDKLQSYIEVNMMDRVVRRYSVLSYDSANESAARGTLDELSGLASDERPARFDELATELAKEDESLVQGDVGWDFLFDASGLLDQTKTIKLQPGDMYPDLIEREQGWQIYECTDRFVFETGTTYAGLTDESLKNAITRAYILSAWSSWSTTYQAQLVDDLQLQVTQMPSDLPYDVTVE